MAWQDEMNALDSAVAAGRITADEYRTRRDELLASSGSGSAAGEPNPFPPPFRWGEQGQGGASPDDAADRTQVVRPSAAAQDADRTQVVRQGAAPDSDRTQVVNPESDRTQVVRPGAPVPGQEFAPGSPPWQVSTPPPGPPPPSRPGGTTPPWNTGEGFAPRQGPDSFDDFRAKPKRGKWVAPVAAVVVALLIIGGVTYFALRSGGDEPTAGGDTTSSAAPASSGSESSGAVESSSAAPTTVDRVAVADLGGSADDLSSVQDFAGVQALNYFTPDETATLQAGTPTDARAAATTIGSNRVVVVTLAMDSAAAATAALDAMTALQVSYGFAAATSSDPAVQVVDTSANPAAPPLVRAHYASGSTLVRIEVSGGDIASIRAAYEQVVTEQSALLAPGA